jgi:hypothetical protein
MTDAFRTAGRRGAKFGAAPHHLPTFGAFFDAKQLPTPPPTFGHYHGLGSNIGMLGNDRTSDCVFAMGAHRSMYWLAPQGIVPHFTDASVVSSYAEMTGYSRWLPWSDRGADMSQFPAWWMKHGILDGAGKRHKCDAAVTLELGNWDQFVLACWLFDGVDIGVALPLDAETMFERGTPWEGAKHGAQGDGHGIAGFGINSKGLLVTGTWGGLQAIDRAWWEAYVVWLDCTFSMEALDAKGLSPEGFDRAGLLGYMARFK